MSVPARALLELTGAYGSHRVRLLEIVTPDGRRKYSFYVLRDDEVIVGFDNAADPFALKLKYGAEYKAHILERIPHCHTEGKTKLALTEEMGCAQFIAWVQINLPST